MEDYIDEKTGLLTCSKCHTSKEALIPGGAELFGTRKFRVLCKCKQEARDREAQEQRQREFRDRVQFLRREAFRDIPGQNWRFDNVQSSDRLSKIKRYADHWEQMQQDGTGLLLFGGVGTGKATPLGALPTPCWTRGTRWGLWASATL